MAGATGTAMTGATDAAMDMDMEAATAEAMAIIAIDASVRRCLASAVPSNNALPACGRAFSFARLKDISSH